MESAISGLEGQGPRRRLQQNRPLQKYEWIAIIFLATKAEDVA
jgi:hypothetical protein